MWKRTIVSYTISYNTNGGTPSSITATAGTAEPSASIQLTGTVPVKSGYKFKGWCTVNPGASTDCPGNLYSSGGQYLLSNGYIVTLYATWRDFQNGDTCGDSTGYDAKYYGGQCWMWKNYGPTTNWNYIDDPCPQGWHIPTTSDADSLLNVLGRGNQLYTMGWSIGNYGVQSITLSTCYTINVSASQAYLSTITWGTCLSSLNFRCVLK